METEAPSDGWYATACRRARSRPRQAARASTEWPEFAPPVAQSDGPLGAVQAADREIGRQTADHRGKHQAPGWTHRLHADGTLTVTTPTGLVAATNPPPY
jgi:hypothetical protein